MKINIDDISNGVWVDYQEGATLKIRPLPASKQEELKKEASHDVLKIERGERIITQKLDGFKYEQLLRDWMIEEWKGIVDRNDKPIPCSPKMKFIILDYDHDMRAFVLDTALKIAAIKRSQQEQNSKN